MAQQKTGLAVKDYLDALVDEDGLRTEVTVTLTDQTLLKASAYLIATAFVSTIVIHFVKNALTKT
ncbi:hypothetical protein [Flavilitoribacter nigricans]|uniref:Uncharacterized protein n=1 Tax=Flavilitoribacter nigricans (strain ATCC 23147 / DSM 23189 / NBRC 102662 / NCIMB 1420 / SS-2) TaxID=1122177 RepID=A0A2D0MXX2_FLAN2|nr:hypothetical protein [Flavilitoribacter nigricans]PHN01132.1 hypothetical protein CRP01_38665 [Flavilitoribacter nigricans DSM 23189 = NBRC 102662]